MKCIICSTKNSVNEAIKHPSNQSFSVALQKLNKIKSEDESLRLTICVGHDIDAEVEEIMKLVARMKVAAQNILSRPR